MLHVQTYPTNKDTPAAAPFAGLVLHVQTSSKSNNTPTAAPVVGLTLHVQVDVAVECVTMCVHRGLLQQQIASAEVLGSNETA